VSKQGKNTKKYCIELVETRHYQNSTLIYSFY